MKICFLSLNSYPLLTNKNLGYSGGAEVEQMHLGRALVSLGYNVSFVTYGPSKSKTEYSNGIRVITTYPREKANQIIVPLKFGLIVSALRKVCADIYFHEGGSMGVLPVFCGLSRKKSVYRISSDALVRGISLTGTSTLSEKIVEPLDIKRANIVVAQSNFQKMLLKERFNVESVVIKNGLAIPEGGLEKSVPPIVLWVGSLSSIKSPHLFVKLAKSVPNVTFCMIGGRTKDEKIYKYIIQATKNVFNFRYDGFVPYQKINDYFSRASILVNTSRVEGFPNTFIQAWANGTPVVSLNVDPDHLIETEHLGFRSGNLKQLISDVVTLSKDEKLRKNMGKNAKRYVEREHDIKRIAKEYHKLFNSLT